jgi:type II secretory pathway component PulK
MLRRVADERGASLVIALAFLAVFAAVVPALLQLGATNLQDTKRLREQRDIVYAADGATEGAIQYLRTHDGCGRPFSTCPVSQFTANLNGVDATTKWAFAGTAIDYDRTFNLTTTTSDGVVRVTAKIITRDASPGNSTFVPVDVVNWTYKR